MKIIRLLSAWPRKTWIVLCVALAIGLLAALGARSYLANRMADLEYKVRGTRQELVVAKQLLKRGDRIGAERVAVRSIPSEFAHSNGIRPDDFTRVENRILAQDVQAGEMILFSMLEPKKPPTFSAHVANGRRAITVPVDEINSISGMLEPGDLIDLIVTLDQQGKKVTVPLMYSVAVMATGQRSLDDPKSGERRVYSTVTLDADPQQAQYLIVARETGRLTALLRNPEDRVANKGNAVNLAALLGVGVGITPGEARQIPVLYGGRSGKIPPEGLRLGQYVTGTGRQAQANPAQNPSQFGSGPQSPPPQLAVAPTFDAGSAAPSSANVPSAPLQLQLQVVGPAVGSAVGSAVAPTAAPAGNAR
jgi:pilus assembly protein CpaB